MEANEAAVAVTSAAAATGAAVTVVTVGSAAAAKGLDFYPVRFFVCFLYPYGSFIETNLDIDNFQY